MRLGWRRRNCEVGKACGGGDEITTGVDDGEAEEVRTMACMVEVAQVCVDNGVGEVVAWVVGMNLWLSEM
jgi:hypothetical protein